MAPIFADLAKKFPNVAFLKVDVDELKVTELIGAVYREPLCNFWVLFLTKMCLRDKQPIAEQFSVEAMPTFLFMKEGEVKDRVVGAVKDDLAAKVGLHAAQ